MTKQTKTILKEVYKLDPALRSHEKELVKIIELMNANKPNIVPDQNFINNLRQKLVNTQGAQTERTGILNLNFMTRKIIYAGVGTLLLALVITPMVLYYDKDAETLQDTAFSTKTALNMISDQAFGTLSPISGGMAVSEADDRGVGAAGGGGMFSSQAVPEAQKIGIAPYYPYNYQFTYIGSDFDLSGTNKPVLVKNTSSRAGSKFAKLFTNTDNGLIDLDKFGGLEVENVILSQKDGYNISLNLSRNTFSIHRTDPIGYAGERVECAILESEGERCGTVGHPPIKQLPSDEAIIQVASSFINKYSISLDNYLAPEVDKGWQRYASEETSYIPQVITVRYQLTINGLPVYDQGGTKSGMMVAVDLVNMQVVAVNDYSLDDYDASNYPTIDSQEKILEWASKGGIRQVFNFEEADETIEIQYSDPHIAYVKTWHYHDGKNLELLAPAMVFPVVEVPKDGHYYSEAIIVPLVEDLWLDRSDTLIPEVIPDMMFIEEDIEGEE